MKATKNKTSFVIIVLIMLLETLVFSRNYKVARINGVITKIRGRRVRVQDKRNGIYWVDRRDIIPRNSKIYDEVNFYKKVRFKSPYSPKTTSFLIKHRKKDMLKIIRNYMVNAEREYGYKLSYKKRKRTSSFFKKIKSFFVIDRAHASPISTRKCFIGGWEGVHNGSSNECLINSELQEKTKCGDNDEGFRCNKDYFPVNSGNSEDKIYSLTKHTNQDDGICIKKTDSLLTRRCYASFTRINGQKNKALTRKSVITDLLNSEKFTSAEKIQKDFDTILNECLNANNSLIQPKPGACFSLRKDLDKVAKEVIEKIEHNKQIDNNIFNTGVSAGARYGYNTGYNQAAYEYSSYLRNILAKIQQQSQGYVPIQYVQRAQSQQPAQVIYYVGQTQGHRQASPYIVNNALNGGNGNVVVITLSPAQANNLLNPQYQQQTQAQLGRFHNYYQERIAYLEKTIAEINKKFKNDDQKAEEEKKKKLAELEELKKVRENLNQLQNAQYKRYAFAESTDECKKLTGVNNDETSSPDLCLIKNTAKNDLNGTYTAYVKKDGSDEYKVQIKGLELDGDRLVYKDKNGDKTPINISSLGEENTDPQIKWSCRIFRDDNAKPCGSVPVMHTSCKAYDPIDDDVDLGIIKLGYLSPKESSKLQDQFPDKSNEINFEYQYDGISKTSTLTEPDNLPIDLSSRGPKIYTNQCSDENDKEQEIDLYKACRILGKSPILLSEDCPGCEHSEKKQASCNMPISCAAEYKNSYKQTKESENFEFDQAVCSCELDENDNYIITDTKSCKIPQEAPKSDNNDDKSKKGKTANEN